MIFYTFETPACGQGSSGKDDTECAFIMCKGVT